jgi:hypothetical protein
MLSFEAVAHLRKLGFRSATAGGWLAGVEGAGLPVEAGV